MKQLAHAMLIAGTSLLTACSNFSSETISGHALIGPGSIQQKETMLKEARAYKKLRNTVEKKTQEYARIIARYKTEVGLAGREDHTSRIKLSKSLRDQRLEFSRKSYLIQPFCTVMGPCPTYNKERKKLDESIQNFAILEKSLRP